MSWASTFITHLGLPVISPSYLVERMTFQGDVAAPGGSPLYSSVRKSGYLNIIDGRSVYLGEQRIDVRTWQWSGGEWGFTIMWNTTTQRADVRDKLERGTPLQLRLGQASYDVADHEVIRLGIVAEIVEQGRCIQVRCWDFLTTLRVRLTQASWPLLFGYLNETAAATTLSVDHNAADGSLSLTDDSGFQADLDTGTYLFWVQPNSGDPFLLQGTYLSGTTYSVTTSGQYGTTDADADAGKTVWTVPLVQGTPCELARKVLTSTGDFGTGDQNGSDDTLPESWGYALDEGYIDSTDMATWEALVEPATGSHAWVWIAAALGDGTWSEPAADEAGIKTLMDAFAQVGMWLCLRQGKITMRCVQDIRGGGAIEDTGVTITDADIMDPMSSKVEWRASGAPFEWLKARVLTGTGGTGEESGRSTNLSWPLEYIYSGDLERWIWSNESAQRVAHRDRIKPWFVRVPEAIELSVCRMKWLQYVPGDVVYLDSRCLRGHFGTTESLDGTVPWMIESITALTPKPAARLRLVVPPEPTTDEPE